jgi:hypothetical protein
MPEGINLPEGTSESDGNSSETAWGRWVRTQPTGVLSRAQEKTGLSWTTIFRAKTHRVNRATARLLSKFARGAFHPDDIAR